MSTVRELALAEATLKAIADKVKDHLDTVKKELQVQLAATAKDTGARSVTVTAPGATAAAATVSLSETPAAAVLRDADALTAWALETVPEHVTERVAREVSPEWLSAVLAVMTDAGNVLWTDPKTGTAHVVPGVEIAKARSTHSVRLRKDGSEALLAAYRGGQVPGVSLPELATGGDGR